MPIIPIAHTATPDAIRMMNTIRANASANYQTIVPIADADNVKQIGSVLVGTPAVSNEFLNALLNRIAKVIITSKAYSNPWAVLKKGELEFGETVEEIFIELIDSFKYNPETAGDLVFKRRVPDIRSAFHVENMKTYYPVTIQQEELRKAFLSWGAVTDFVNKIIAKIYTSYEYDEFNIMKYLIAKAICNGEIHTENADIATDAKAAAATIKGFSNKLEFMSTEFNMMGVHTHTAKENQYLILDAITDAKMDVDALATAFNMDKVKFMGRRLTVDSFATLDEDRLEHLFTDEKTLTSTYTRLTDAEKERLETVQGILLDADWVQMYGTLKQFAENYNGNGLYYNYFFHVWASVSSSPFANAIAFLNGGGK